RHSPCTRLSKGATVSTPSAEVSPLAKWRETVMSPCEPDVLYIPMCCASKKAPCPKCGKRGKLLRTHERDVRTIAYHKVAWLRVTYGEYRARCGCCTTFCN